jgi:nicotinamide riboside kinase
MMGMRSAFKIAILGAESTGKSTLAADLARALDGTLPVSDRPPGSPSACWVPEVLRQWCEEAGRTPRADEQAGILQAQHARIEHAAGTHGIVVCDTTGVMTAVYSRMVFGDRSLEAPALAWHRSIDLTLLMALDLPWVADGLQRDGPHVREPVDRCLRELLGAGGLACTVIGGVGPARLRHALSVARRALERGPTLRS